MRRTKTTTYGQRGGEGPNTGKKAAVFAFTRPDGVEGKTRVFKNPPEGAEAFVILYPPHNGNGWITGRVAQTEVEFEDVMKHYRNPAEGSIFYRSVPPVVVPCRRLEK